MSFENRMRCLSDLRELGFQVGAGFMVGSPYQTARELAEDAYKNSASEETLNALSDYWDSTAKLLSLSVNLREIDSATENLLVFLSACRDGYEYGIEQSYTLFIDSLDDIVKYEKFEMANIL